MNQLLLLPGNNSWYYVPTKKQVTLKDDPFLKNL